MRTRLIQHGAIDLRQLRYGIEDKCSTYEWLESYLMDRDDCCIEPDVRMNIPRIEAQMCGG